LQEVIAAAVTCTAAMTRHCRKSLQLQWRVIAAAMTCTAAMTSLQRRYRVASCNDFIAEFLTWGGGSSSLKDALVNDQNPPQNVCHGRMTCAGAEDALMTEVDGRLPSRWVYQKVSRNDALQ
jgi:hypothetical protein